MITKRIIPCLDIKDGRVVKGTNFKNLNDVSSPVELAKLAENRAREHAQNLIKMMYHRKAMRKEAGMGMREGKEDAGPL